MIKKLCLLIVAMLVLNVTYGYSDDQPQEPSVKKGPALFGLRIGMTKDTVKRIWPDMEVVNAAEPGHEVGSSRNVKIKHIQVEEMKMDFLSNSLEALVVHFGERKTEMRALFAGNLTSAYGQPKIMKMGESEVAIWKVDSTSLLMKNDSLSMFSSKYMAFIKEWNKSH